MAASNQDKQDVDTVVPIIQRLKSKNKWSFHGDYLMNFEKNLIPINRSMQQLFKRCVLVTSHWFRTFHQDIILPQNVDIIIGQFYTLPRCAGCGMYDNLWLNLCDGYIGCGRQQWDGTGGNACALKHYSLLHEQVEQSNDYERKPYFSLVVKLGTISEHGADVFCYKRDFMVMDALFVEDEDNDGDLDMDIHRNRKRGSVQQWGAANSNRLYIEELQPLLAYWGIEMGKMYKYDKTMNEVEIALNADFVNSFFRSLR